MKPTDIFFIIKRRFFEKRNIIFVFISIILIFSLLISLTIFHYFNNYSRDDLKRNLAYREIILTKNLTEKNIQNLEKLDHVIYVKKSYYSKYITSIKLNNQEDLNLNIMPLKDITDIKIVKGSLPKNNNDAICATNFYSNELEEKDKFNNNFFIKDKDLIGASLTLNDESFKITGTFDSFIINEQLNTCFINEDNFNALVGNYPEDFIQYTLKVDNYKNVGEVASKIKNMGIKYNLVSPINTNMEALKPIPIFICIVAILVSYLVLYNFIKKKVHYHLANYGVLKATGYTNKDIYKIELLENLIITTLCFIFTTIIFLIIYKLILNIPPFPAIIFKCQENLRLSYLSFAFTYLILILLNIICLFLLTKRLINNKNIYELLEEKI